MIFKKILFIMCILTSHAFAAECQLYENTHPGYPLLNSAHSQGGKCSTCASCHINAIFIGTPKTCDACHGSSGLRASVFKSAAHFPITGTLCSDCHNALSFTASWNMNHIAANTMTCITCHNGSYNNYNAQSVTAMHIPIGTIACNLCHISTTSFGIITTNVQIHTTIGSTALIASSASSCNICHTPTGLYNSEGAGAMHSPSGSEGCIQCHRSGSSPRARQTMSLTHHNNGMVNGQPATDCSFSGCHKPLGNTGKLYSQWDN